jgi:L-alanine-DL-glutamate epimerase-like enolase superfamily enzyme
MWMVGEEIFEDPYAIDGGEVELPEGPGLGLEPDRDALTTHQIE